MTTNDHELRALQRDLAARPGRLLLLVGDQDDRLARAVAEAWDSGIVSVGRRMADGDAASRPDLVAMTADGSVITDLDWLFWAPALELEVLTLLRQASRGRAVAFAWPGEIQGGVARYSESGRRDFYEARLENAVVLRVRPDAYAGEPGYTTEQVGA